MQKTVGSKAEVYHGVAKHTSGGLEKKDLMQVDSGRIISRKKHLAGKKAIKHLFALGYKPKKGTFKLFKSKKTQKRKRGRKCGGHHEDDVSGANTACVGGNQSRNGRSRRQTRHARRGGFEEAPVGISGEYVGNQGLVSKILGGLKL